MRAYDELKIFQRKRSLSVLWDGIKNGIESLIKIIKQMLQKLYQIIYNFFASIGNLFLKIYNWILSLFGVSYKSESTTGDSCECNAPATSKSPASSSNSPTSSSGGSTSTANTSGNKTTLESQPNCKDSLFVDLIIVFIILLPFKNYIPWQKITAGVNNFLLVNSQRFNISLSTFQVLFYASLAVILYLIDVNFYF